MFIKEYISRDYPAFGYGDSVRDAAETARDFGYSHIFIEKNGLYAGALSQSFLDERPDGLLGALEVHFERFAAPEDGNLLDTVRLFHTFEAGVAPVISKEEKYLGYISCHDVFAEFSRYPLFSETGAVITLQVPGAHYSFTEIAKIVEGNNAKMYGCYISAITEDGVQVTLKISSENLSSIDETFERYGYLVVDKSYQNQRDELLRDRMGFFTKYLEV